MITKTNWRLLRNIVIAALLIAWPTLTLKAEDSMSIYSAPKKILPSKDFTARVNGKEAYIFYSAANKYRDDFLAGAASDSRTRDSWVSLETTHQFYLAVREDLLQQARAASAETMNGNFVAHLLRTPFGG